jgi:Protein of unknown function (DUF2817)
VPEVTDFFSVDYATARSRFVNMAKSAGARLYSLAMDARGPHNFPLSIDIAWLGNSVPRRVVLHQTGVHGVEGFTGAAIQLSLLTGNKLRVGADSAIIFVHILNPYGMAWLRRTNENNVDLNRNCLGGGDMWSGAPEGYRRLDHLINPKSPPSADFFLTRAILRVLFHGYKPLKQAVAIGQYEFPDGLFYGGSRIEQGPALYKRWLTDHLDALKEIYVIDVHTGLGSWCQESIFLETPAADQELQRLSLRLDRPLIRVTKGDSPGYVIRGGVSNLLQQVFGQARLLYFVEEFGTYSALRVMSALREENRWHLYGCGHLEHPTKSTLKEMLCPSPKRWRKYVHDKGCDLAYRVIELISAPQPTTGLR